MAKVLDNGDVSSQAPMHTAALVTDQHTSADRCPARIWGSRVGKSAEATGQALLPKQLLWPGICLVLQVHSLNLLRSPEAGYEPFPVSPCTFLGMHGPQGFSVGTVSCLTATATSFTASPQESRLLPSHSTGRQKSPMGYDPDAVYHTVLGMFLLDPIRQTGSYPYSDTVGVSSFMPPSTVGCSLKDRLSNGTNLG